MTGQDGGWVILSLLASVHGFDNYRSLRKVAGTMPRTMAPTFIPTATASGGTAYLALENIPEEIKQEVEATYAGLKENPNGRMRVAFDTADELNEFINQVISYCAQRPAGAIRFRKSPTRNLPATMMDYRVSDLREPVQVEVPAVTVPTVTVPAKATATTRRR